MAKVLTKSQIIQAIADAHKDKLARKDVAACSSRWPPSATRS